MSKAYEFLKECGVFFVLTINDDCPAGRPFGAVMEYRDDLYISTTDTKEVYKQMKDNPHIQIVSMKTGTRDWMRINGIATECNDIEIKKKMLEECPALTKHFSSFDAPHYAVFQVKVMDLKFF